MVGETRPTHETANNVIIVLRNITILRQRYRSLPQAGIVSENRNRFRRVCCSSPCEPRRIKSKVRKREQRLRGRAQNCREQTHSEVELQAARTKWEQGRGGANSVGLAAKSIGLRTLHRASVRHALAAAEGFGSLPWRGVSLRIGKGWAYRARKHAVAKSWMIRLRADLASGRKFIWLPCGRSGAGCGPFVRGSERGC
jgi:hypothetical protein